VNHLEPVGSSPFHFTVRGNPGQKFMPYGEISEEEFYLLSSSNCDSLILPDSGP
jgi:hypothetical protein